MLKIRKHWPISFLDQRCNLQNWGDTCRDVKCDGIATDGKDNSTALLVCYLSMLPSLFPPFPAAKKLAFVETTSFLLFLYYIKLKHKCARFAIIANGNTGMTSIEILVTAD